MTLQSRKFAADLPKSLLTTNTAILSNSTFRATMPPLPADWRDTGMWKRRHCSAKCWDLIVLRCFCCQKRFWQHQQQIFGTAVTEFVVYFDCKILFLIPENVKLLFCCRRQKEIGMLINANLHDSSTFQFFQKSLRASPEYFKNH